MDAEEFFRREAAGLLARYPGMPPEEIARETRKDDHRGDPAVAATVLEVAARIRAQAGGLESCTTDARRATSVMGGVIIASCLSGHE